MVQHQCFIFVHFYDDGINPRTIIVLIKIRFPLNLFRGPLDITDIVLGDTKSPVPLSRKLCFPHIITLYIVLLLYIFSLLQNSLTPSFPVRGARVRFVWLFWFSKGPLPYRNIVYRQIFASLVLFLEQRRT